MSKGLEALEKGFWKLTHKGNINYYNIVEKELKTLEIIKENDVDVVALKISISLKQYNCKEDGRCPLTKEEYDLLKEVLNGN